MKFKISDILKNLKYVFIIAFVLCGLVINPKIAITESTGSDFSLIEFVTAVLSSFETNQFYVIAVLFFLIVLFNKVKNSAASNSHKIWSFIMGTLFSIIYIVGESFYQTNSMELIIGEKSLMLKSIVRLLSFIILFYWIFILSFLCFDKISENKIDASNNSQCVLYSRKKLTLTLFLCWVPFLLIYYPAMIYTDTITSFLQWNGYQHEMSNCTVLIEGSQLSNHHPIFTTMLYGLSAQFGQLINNVSVGIFLYTICQQLWVAFCLANLIYNVQMWGCAKYVKYLRLLYICIPFFGLWSATLTKDVLLASMMMLFMAELIKIIKSKGDYFKKPINCIIYILVGIFMSLMKNQGIYYFVITTILVLLYFKKYWRQLIIVFTIPVLFWNLWCNFILPSCNVAPGGRQEAISLMLQQTANCVVNYGDKMSEDEKNIIDKVLPFDRIKDLYTPESSDPVKFQFKQEATEKELTEYKRLWLRQMFKYPKEYIEASINNFYGYYYPSVSRTYVYYDYPIGEWYNWAEIMKIKRPDILDIGRTLVKMIITASSMLPLVCLFFMPGFYGTIFLFFMGYGILKKKSKEILAVMPLILSFAVNMVSPENANWRYTIPIVFLLPIMIAIFLRNNSYEQ